eukprot:TRINITY_DN31040_c0_g1_i1.p1 TRINITY_DN31040_c0_g1~~TRINITY_DN31040_c0_g1_i1.p1  ORF type:complete len:407 (+),score=48.54 TRINITY_DN31040_c0_g1_i1:159-1379(+)
MGQLVTLCPTDYREDEGFDSQYEIDEMHCIGTGKFAVVHLCWKRNSPEMRYALKVINTRVGDMASLNRIREEIMILQTLGNHPGIVTLVDVDESQPGNIRLVMELCEGGELYDRVQQKRYYPEPEAKVCCRNLLEATRYIHGKGIMHRDLKLENILLASKVSHTDIKISDFGLAKLSRDYPRRLPRSHSICGSDFYLAPEVIKQEEYGREVDIWAVGVITYVLLSGSLPFFHNVLHKLYRQIVERDLMFPEQAWKDVSKGAWDFILRLLQVRAGDRLTSEQALNHPWLRGTTGSSFNSFDHTSQMSGNQGNPNYYSAEMLRIQSQVAVPNPLEHAHKVNEPKEQVPAQRAQPQPVATSPSTRPPVSHYEQFGAQVPVCGGSSPHGSGAPYGRVGVLPGGGGQPHYR